MLQGKFIDQLQNASVIVSGFAFPNAASSVVTSAVSTALSTASRSGGTVDVQVASGTQHGIVIDSAKVYMVVDSTTKERLVDASNREVYGKLTHAAGVYTLSLYTNVAGVETAYTPAATTIDFEFEYRYKLGELPFDAMTRGTTRYVGNDPMIQGQKMRFQLLTPTAQNTLPALANAYNSNVITGGIFILSIGQMLARIGTDFTVAGTTVTLLPAGIGANVETTDDVRAWYSI